MRRPWLSILILIAVGVLAAGCRTSLTMGPTPGPSAIAHDGYQLDCGPTAQADCVAVADRIDAEQRAHNLTIQTTSIVLMEPDAYLRYVYCWERRPPFDRIALVTGRMSAGCHRGKQLP